MKNINKFLYLFIFLIININYLNGLSDTDFQELKSLVNGYDLSGFSINPLKGDYDFCNSTYSVTTCQENGDIDLLYLKPNVPYSNSPKLDDDDIKVSNFKKLVIIELDIEKDLFYNKYENCNHYEYTFKLDSITKVLPISNYFSISTTMMQDKNLEMKFLKSVSIFKLSNSFVNLIPNGVDGERDNLIELNIWLKSIPSLVNYLNLRKLQVYLKSDISLTLTNFENLKNLKELYIEHEVNSIKDWYFNFQNLTNLEILLIKGEFNNISTISNLRNLINLKRFEILITSSNSATPFDYPTLLIPPSSLEYFKISNARFYNQLPTQYGFSSNTIIEFKNNLINTYLPKLELPLGLAKSYDLTKNNIKGTIDESWCSTELIIKDNPLMTGEIPSCFACYFNGSQDIFERFNGCNFTNHNQDYQCTTFKPIFKLISNSNSFILNQFQVTGIDIGFDPISNWLVNDSPSDYKIIIPGKEYILSQNVKNGDTPLINKEYFNVSFKQPINVLYTFPVVDKLPNLKNVNVALLENGASFELTINGKFFSTYDGFKQQNVNFKGQDCEISNTSFFKVICKTPPVSSKTNNNNNPLKKLIITSNSTRFYYYVNTSPGVLNDKVCSSVCGSKGGCDLTSGNCICDDTRWGGIDCNLPLHYTSAIEPVDYQGGESKFFGWYSDIHDQLTITVGIIPCKPITFNSSDEIRCILPSGGTGVQNVNITQNGYSTINDKYQYSPNGNLPCPNSCSNHGTCNHIIGECICDLGYSRYDCSLFDNKAHPNSTTSIDPYTGGSNVLNQDIQFQIYFKSLLELDFNGKIINEYNLQNNWIIANDTQSNDNNNQFILNQKIQDNCTLISKIEEIKSNDGTGKKQFTFGGTTFSLDDGSIKFSISINNYLYENTLNSLQLQLISSVDQQPNLIIKNNQCNLKSTEIETNENENSIFNYIKISKNNKILSGRFLNKLESDGRPSFLSTSISKFNDSTVIVLLNLPTMCTSCLIDPDFSVLVDPSYKSDCNSPSPSRPKYFLPVVIVCSVVGACILVITAFLVYKKNTAVKVQILKLKKLNKKIKN